MSIRHCCETHGCYIKTQTPDWGFLDNSFSGKIRVSDIDGVVEVNGYLLILEWKGINVAIPQGQEYMYLNATKRGTVTAFVINGNAKENIVTRIKVYKDGAVVKDTEATNETLKSFCRYWESQARNNGFEMVA